MAGLTITPLREITMLLFEVGLPSPEPLGIAGGRLTVTISGPSGAGQPIVVDTAPGNSVVRGQQLVGNHGDTVRASFVYIKRNGKPSTVPATIEAVLADHFPAPNPGPITINVYAES